MIQIRKGIFETNSSSANVLILPKYGGGIHVPKKFFYMDDDTSLKPTEIVINHIISKGWSGTDYEAVNQIVNFLYLNGVEEIVYGGKDPAFEQAVERYKDKPEDLGVPKNWNKELLLQALFGSDTECSHYGDGDRPYNYSDTVKDPLIQAEDNDNIYIEYYAG